MSYCIIKNSIIWLSRSNALEICLNYMGDYGTMMHISTENKKLISVILPFFDEEENVRPLYSSLCATCGLLEEDYRFEFVFINDGSHDAGGSIIEEYARGDERIRYIEFSRNFGKEIAVTAGMHACCGDAAITIDADLQHPIELIPEFVKKWGAGAEVVIGVRTSNKGGGVIKKVGSFLFYKIINRISNVEVLANATDFRLIDRAVIDEFNRFTETQRMTRALIDWLGFRREYIYFEANERMNGKARYGFFKLLKLAVGSVVSLSLFPLRLIGYLGCAVTFIFGCLGLYILLGNYFFHESFASSFTGPAQLAILIIFLVGVILMSLGLITLYIANIHGEVINRPLYVIRKK